MSAVASRARVSAAVELRRAASRPHGEVFISAPRSFQRENPDYIARTRETLAKIVGKAAIVGPGKVDLFSRAYRHPGAILVVLARKDWSLGEQSAREFRAFRANRRPTFVVLPGHGLMSSRELRFKTVDPGERSEAVFGHLELKA